MKNPQMDRESWLTEAAQFILDDIIAPHYPTQIDRPYRISIGFPSGKPSKVLAQCWKSEASADNTNEIFVSPTVEDSTEILAALTHELIHYTDNNASGHKNHFAKLAREVGLAGKLTATTAGPELSDKLTTIIDLLGNIPHAALDASRSGKKKQGTRMLKIECTVCTFAFRATQTQIDKLPTSYGETLADCPACGRSETLTVAA